MSEGLLFVGGGLLQWLRQYPWFNDALVLLTAFGIALVGTWLQHAGIDSRAFMLQALEYTPVVLGGTMVGHMASHAPMVSAVVPKFKGE
jgi:hypothetical protein